jgi:hypothetical protein
MKGKGNARREMSSKMGIMPHSASAGERTKKSARQHGGNESQSIAHLNEDVKCFATNGRK